jgi:hypothetical protein
MFMMAEVLAKSPEAQTTDVSKPGEVPHKMVGKSTQRILPSALQLGTSRLP